MNDKQCGQRYALGLILEDVFTPATWQKGLARERREAAERMQESIEQECLRKSSSTFQKTMKAVTGPFLKTLRGECLPEKPFLNLPDDAETQEVNEALAIVRATLNSFVRGKGPDWTWTEIADSVEAKIKAEARRCTADNSTNRAGQAYLEAGFLEPIRGVTMPFCKILKAKTV